ncbi:entericidin A/B family lipoprotein [Silanimonas lenta]|jgi:entericidin A|nr:entericidin A/B family lipoprotein [Silanimonas lenta]GIX38324.1 MAG: hypothetical protein KatS3mg127_1563 [Silanimonas sp.]
MKPFRLLALATLVLMSLTACNTVSGFGKDVKKVGEKMTEKAEEAKR